MKKKRNKGFTLIELLAVIVILAVIALIATPLIMNVINNAKKGVARDAGYNIIKAGELKAATEGIAGTEPPYHYDESSTTVNVILDHNITYKVAWNSSGNNADGMKEVKEALDNDTANWNKNLKPRLIEANEIAKITGNTEFDSSNRDKDNWFYFESNGQDRPQLSQGQAKYKWLFDYTEDCTSYGCSIADNSTIGYWTSIPYVSDSDNAWRVSDFGRLNLYNVDDVRHHGLRPVITILKSILS